MTTIKKVVDRKTAKTTVVIRISYTDAMRLDNILNMEVADSRLNDYPAAVQTFFNDLRTDLHRTIFD